MKKIAIFQSDLHVGGITRSLINLLKNIENKKYDVDLFIFSEGIFFKDELGDNIHIFILPRSNKLLKYLPINMVMKLYAPAIDLKKEYDIAIDYNSYWHECSVGALKVKAKKRIMWLHSDIIEKQKVEFRYKIVWNLQYSKLKLFDQFVAVSDGVKDSFYKAVKVNNKKKPVLVINNLINVDGIIQKSKENVPIIVNSQNYNLVCVGHLGKEKGIDLLISSFAEAYKQRKDIELYIIGDGPEKSVLEQQIKRLQLQNNVHLLGNKENPFPYEKQMDAFALMSRYEGQGIVLWEAKVLGLEVFMSQNLEKYNTGILGTSDMVKSIVGAKKREKKLDYLDDYTKQIQERLGVLLC